MATERFDGGAVAPSVPHPSVVTPEGVSIIAPPGAWFDASAFRGMVYSHPTSQAIRHLVAYRSEDYDNERSSGAGRYERIEDTAAAGYRVLVADIASNRAYRGMQGEFQDGDVSVMFLPDELPLREADVIIPWGRRGDGSDIATLPQAELMGHGMEPFAESKPLPTLVIPGNAGGSTGQLSGTSAEIAATLLLLAAGDTIVAVNEKNPTLARNLQSFSGNGTLTFSAPLPAMWAGQIMERRRDRLLREPVRSITDIRFADGTLANPSSYTVSETGYISWNGLNGRMPSPGERYAVRYTSYPKYVVGKRLSSTGSFGGGGSMPYIVLCHLWQPERNRQ